MCSAHSARHKWNDKYTNANQGDALWMHKMSSRRLWNQRRGLTHDSRSKLRWPRRKCTHNIISLCCNTGYAVQFQNYCTVSARLSSSERPRVVVALLRSPEVVIYPWRIFYTLICSEHKYKCAISAFAKYPLGVELQILLYAPGPLISA